MDVHGAASLEAITDALIDAENEKKSTNAKKIKETHDWKRYVRSILQHVKFGSKDAAIYHFRKHHPEVPLKYVRAYYREKPKGYVKNIDRDVMGSKFSVFDDVYQLDIYYEGKVGYLIAVNVNTKRAWCKKIKSKNTNDVMDAFESFVRVCHPRFIECDAEKAFTSMRFVDYLKEHDIEQRVSLNALHTDLSVVNRLCRTLRQMAETNDHHDVEALVKQYNKTYHSSIKMTPNEMTADPDAQKIYIHGQLQKREEQVASMTEDKLKKHDRVRYILDSETFKKNQSKYKLSKYYYLIETQHSPFSFDIIAKDGSVKTLPRYRLIKIDDEQAKSMQFAPSIENESRFFIYDEIMEYHPYFKKNGSINPLKTYYVVRVITRTPRGKKVKRYMDLHVSEVRIAKPTEVCKLEREFVKKHADEFEIDDRTRYVVPIV